MDITEIRKEFAYLTQPGSVIYFNHAAISPLPKVVYNAMNHHIEQRKISPVEDFEALINAISDTRETISEMISGSSDNIAFTQNTSSGLSYIADGFNWKPGDEIIINDVEFPANVYPFLNQKKRGVLVKFAKSNNGVITLDSILELINPRTKMVSISLVQFLSGFNFPIQKLGEICKKENIYLVVDGIQAMGTSIIDVKKFGIDAFVSGSHKWVMGPQGIAFVYVSDRLFEELIYLPMSWLSVETPWELLNYNQKTIPTIQRVEMGMYNIAGILGLRAALKFIHQIGTDQINNRLVKLTTILRNSLSVCNGINLFGSNQMSEYSGITSYTLPSEIDSDLLMKNLTVRRIIVSIREGKLRLSPHFYNTEDEINHVADSLKEFLC